MKKNDKKDKKKKTEIVGEALPQLTLFGNREVQLDGCRDLQEYDDEKIAFGFGKISVCIFGNGLVIKNYGSDYAEICGEISDISFE